MIDCAICGVAIADPSDVTWLGADRVHLDCIRETPPRDSERPGAERPAPAAPPVIHTERDRLDIAMREVLIQLSICSHVPATGYQPTSSRASDEHPGGRRPPGDIGEAKFARMYGPPFWEPTPEFPGADSDARRRQVVKFARAELDWLRGKGLPDERATESEDQVVKRMLRDARGWSPEAVEASSFRMSARLVRKHRSKAGLDPEDGRDPERQPTKADHRRERNERIRAKYDGGRGPSLRDIAAEEGISFKMVHKIVQSPPVSPEAEAGKGIEAQRLASLGYSHAEIAESLRTSIDEVDGYLGGIAA